MSTRQISKLNQNHWFGRKSSELAKALADEAIPLDLYLCMCSASIIDELQAVLMCQAMEQLAAFWWFTLFSYQKSVFCDNRWRITSTTDNWYWIYITYYYRLNSMYDLELINTLRGHMGGVSFNHW